MVSRRARIVLAVLAAALGFFVDAYDLILYSIVRVPSLTGLGVPPGALLSVGVDLLNAQLVGMLIGGIVWGVWGDRFGRRSVLFGSILLYSAATLINAWVRSIPAYMACRFVAGLGLAGELGAGITLVSELMPARSRGYGTMIVAAVGVTGVVVARIMATIKAHTRAPVFYHSCGAVTEFLDDLVEIGVDILNPVQVSAAGMDTAQLKKRFGKRLSFWGGGCDTQTVLARGAPADVRKEVRRRIRDLAPGGGFVFNPVHNIQPLVPPENMAELFRAAQEYGRYPIS